METIITRIKQIFTKIQYTRILSKLLALKIILILTTPSATEERPPLYPGLANELKKINSGDYHKWPQHSAGYYFGNPNYTAEEYNAFFRRFFSETPYLSMGFSSFIGYAMFLWFSPEASLNIQRGICPVALDILLEYATHSPEELSKRLRAERDTKNERFMIFGHMVSECSRKGLALDSSFADIVAPKLKELIKKWDYLHPATTIDNDKLPLISSFKILLYFILSDIERDNRELAAKLGYSGRREAIWRKHQLFIFDNNQLHDSALERIDNILSNIPPHMHQLRGITVRDYLDSKNYETGIPFSGVRVNIFGAPPGIQTENSFPKDIEGFESDQFSLVVVHEVNHAVDSRFVGANKAWYEKKMSLINDAGNEPRNYLRSMAPAGYFKEAPQEFFAAIANQYFANTAKTFELGYVRCRKGNTKPMDQALFFLTVYADEKSAPAFQIDYAGNLKVERIPLTKDNTGKITEIKIAGRKYIFNYTGNKLSSCMRL